MQGQTATLGPGLVSPDLAHALRVEKLIVCFVVSKGEVPFLLPVFPSSLFISCRERLGAAFYFHLPVFAVHPLSWLGSI